MYENVIMKTIILHANWNIISKIKDVAREMAQRLKSLPEVSDSPIFPVLGR